MADTIAEIPTRPFCGTAGALLAQWRKRVCLSQPEIVNRCHVQSPRVRGISHNNIGHWERNRRAPSFRQLHALVVACDVGPADLVEVITRLGVSHQPYEILALRWRANGLTPDECAQAWVRSIPFAPPMAVTSGP